MRNFALHLDIEQDMLRGNVKKVITRKYSLRTGKKVLDDLYEKEYDKMGNRTETKYLTVDGELKFKQVSTFSKGHKSGYKNYNVSGNIISEGHFELDANGNITAKFHNGNCKERYQLDNHGRIIAVQYMEIGAIDELEYDDNGLVVKQISRASQGGVFNAMFGGNVNKLTIYKNDEFGNILEFNTYNADTENLMIAQKSTINQQGDVIEMVSLGADGTVYSNSKYKYAYDKKGNWIELYDLNDNDMPYKLTTREILYY
jgi:hypothetical protein